MRNHVWKVEFPPDKFHKETTFRYYGTDEASARFWARELGMRLFRRDELLGTTSMRAMDEADPERWDWDEVEL